MAKSLDYKLSNMIVVKKTDTAIKLKKSSDFIDLSSFVEKDQLIKFFNDEIDRVLIGNSIDLKKIFKELSTANDYEKFVEILNSNNANIFSDFKLKQIQKNFSSLDLDKIISELREYDIKTRKLFTKLSRSSNNSYLERGIWTLYACNSFLEGITAINKSEIKAPLINIPIDFKTEGSKTYLVKKDKTLTLNERLYVFLMREYNSNIALKEFTGRSNLEEIIKDLEQITQEPIEQVENASTTIFQKLSVTPGFICINAELTGGKLKQDLSDILEKNEVDPFEQTTEQKSIDYYENEIVSGNKILLQVHRPINIYQKYAISSSLNQNTVIIGAPGTGKSEVITNLIANIIYEQKNAMLVSEKKAALDVLINRAGKLNPLILYTYDFDSKDNFYQYILNIEEKLGQWYRNDNFTSFALNTTLNDKIKEFNTFYSHFANLINSEIDFANCRDPYNENYIEYISDNLIRSEIVEKIRISNYLMLPDGSANNQLWLSLANYLSNSIVNDIAKKLQQWFEINEYIFDVSNFDSFIRNIWNEYVHFNKLCNEHKELLDNFPNIIKIVLQSSLNETRDDILKSANESNTLLAKYIYYRLEKGINVNIKKLRFHRFSNRSEKHRYKKFAPDLREFLNSFSRIKNLNWISYNKLQEFELSTLEWKTIIQENWWLSLFSENPLFQILKTRLFQESITFFKRNEAYFTKDNDALIFASYITSLQEKLKTLDSQQQSKMLAMFKDASRSHKPSISLFVRKYYHQLRMIFPIWVMNPDVVAEFIPLNRNEFDYGIFDEASQMFLERGYPLVYRCTYNTIAGDSNQLKPTSFFMTRFDETSTKEIKEKSDPYSTEPLTLDDNEEIDENESLVSLLERAENARWNKFHLRNHYRSVSKRLIEFSNINIYNSNLHIASLNGLWKNKSLEVVDVNGIWENRSNIEEANEIIRAIRLNHKKFDSILVIAFNLQQANLIEDMIINGDNVDTIIKEKLNKNIVITNLESVQGSEADLVLLSVSFAPNEEGILRANFGALNRDGGRNRLNVAITRAKNKMIVFKSFKASDILQQKNLSSDASIFINWIRYLDVFNDMEAEELSIFKKKNQVPQFNNKFMSEIYETLMNLNIDQNFYITANLPVGDKTVDIGIMDQNSNRCIIGILADRWSTTMTAKSKSEECDFQFFLESRDYNIFRIKEYEWLLMKETILESIKTKLLDYKNSLVE
ncbi:AAA domain-containing protein [Mycoplasmoides pirum]|uniref:AAA domain-containing protein n=1 Tax=Mycoplasmoides pirum TaxID=2122 RepID=UPI0004829FB5|nr:AAA domain-containing protein [Mycoplasmoides pirum]